MLQPLGAPMWKDNTPDSFVSLTTMNHDSLDGSISAIRSPRSQGVCNEIQTLGFQGLTTITVFRSRRSVIFLKSQASLGD